MQIVKSIVEEQAVKPSSPMCRVSLPFCHLSLSHLTRAISVYRELAGRSHIVQRAGVKFMQREGMCYGKNYYCMASPWRVSLLLEFSGQQLYICHMAEPHSCLTPAVSAKSIYAEL